MNLRQDIDLLQRPRRSFAEQLLDLRKVAASALVLVVLWALSGFYLSYAIGRQQSRLLQAQNELAMRQSELAQLQVQLDPVRLAAARQARRQTLQQSLSAYQTLAPYRAGYTPRLQQLASLPMPGLWLTRIRLDHGSRGPILLEGKVMGSEYLSPYVHALHQAALIPQDQLNQLQIHQDEKAPTSSFLLSDQRGTHP